MGYKKIIIFSTFLLANLAFPAPVNEANRIIDIQQRQLEQERVRQRQEKMQKEFENTKFDSPKPQVDKDIESDNLNSNKFLIKSINIKDNDRLLSQREKNKIIGKYVFLELSSNDIQNLLTDLTNKLISKGYTTSVVNFSRSSKKFSRKI